MAPLPRPLLNLGAMAAASVPENVERMTKLVDIFNKMLQKELALQDDPAGGSTDCATFVRVPFQDPEAYLVCEHELSHTFAETDLVMTKTALDSIVEKLLTRARIATTEPRARAYKPVLYDIAFSLWNILEDWRCLSVWGELYFGGAHLLRQRWESIAKHSDEALAEVNFFLFMMRAAANTSTPGASPEYQVCATHIRNAVTRVELVDNIACLAITAKLIDDIADELLKQFPPPQMNPLNNQQTSQQKLDALKELGKGGKPPAAVPSANQGAGQLDVVDTSALRGKPSKASASTMRKIRRLTTASTTDTDADGKTSFDKLCIDGATAMAERIELAKAALGLLRENDAEKEKRKISQLSADTGIEIITVTPIDPLVSPSRRSGQARKYLEMIKMEVQNSFAQRGTRINVQRAIQGRLSNNHALPKFIKTEESGGLHLLLLCDVSGSMSGSGINMVQQAVADAAHVCTNFPITLDVWAFSHQLYIFTRLGGIIAPGVWMTSTSTVQAVDAAAQWLRGERGSRAMILMTDGEPTSLRKTRSTGTPKGDLSALFKELQEDRVVVATLGIGGDKESFREMLRGTRFGHASRLKEVPDALTEAIRGIVEAHLRASK